MAAWVDRYTYPVQVVGDTKWLNEKTWPASLPFRPVLLQIGHYIIAQDGTRAQIRSIAWAYDGTIVLVVGLG